MYLRVEYALCAGDGARSTWRFFQNRWCSCGPSEFRSIVTNSKIRKFTLFRAGPIRLKWSFKTTPPIRVLLKAAWPSDLMLCISLVRKMALNFSDRASWNIIVSDAMMCLGYMLLFHLALLVCVSHNFEPCQILEQWCKAFKCQTCNSTLKNALIFHPLSRNFVENNSPWIYVCVTAFSAKPWSFQPLWVGKNPKSQNKFSFVYCC